MGKSNKKSNVKVAVVTPTIPKVEGKKGKRQPEAEVEIQPLPKKLKSANKVPQKKKQEISSSSEEASESEEEVKLSVSKKTILAKKVTGKGSSSEEEDSSDEEPAPILVPAAKKSAKLANNGSVAALKNGKAESSDGSESDSEEEEAQVKKPLQTRGTGNFFKGKPVEGSSDDDDSEDEPSDVGSDSEESEEEETVQKVKKTQPAKIVKKESSDEDSSDGSENDDSNESDDEPSKKQSVKALTPKTPKTPVTSGVKTLFVGNLSFSIDADTIVEFFEDAGEVVDVRLATNDDGSYRGYGHVEFATEEAAAKAMEKTGQDLLGRAVRLDFAAERGAPGTKPDFKSRNQQDQKSGCTVFVRGFDKNQEEDDIRNSLQEHFGDCGSIENIRIPKDYDSGTFKGFAYVEFKDGASLSKALELGTDELSVEEAMARSGGRDGSGRRGGGRGFGGRGGRFSGGRGGRGGGGRGTPRGRGRGDRNGGRGTPKFSSSGKKTTFGDD